MGAWRYREYMGTQQYEIYLRVQYLTSERSELVRYRDWTQEDKFHISKLPCIILSYLLYKFRSIISKGEYSKGHIRTCVWYNIRTRVLIRHFSVAKIPITHCSLYNKSIINQYIYWKEKSILVEKTTRKIYIHLHLQKKNYMKQELVYFRSVF